MLVLTPCYYKGRMTADALRRHFEAVADASPVPVYLYSVPAFTGLAWPAGLARTLAAHPRIRGIKESSGDVGLLARIVESVPERSSRSPAATRRSCTRRCAWEPRAASWRSPTAPRVPRCACSGRGARATTRPRGGSRKRIAPLATAVTATHGVAGLKLALGLAGLRGGTVRAPLLPAAPGLLDEIRPLLEAANAAGS